MEHQTKRLATDKMDTNFKTMHVSWICTSSKPSDIAVQWNKISNAVASYDPLLKFY